MTKARSRRRRVRCCSRGRVRTSRRSRLRSSAAPRECRRPRSRAPARASFNSIALKLSIWLGLRYQPPPRTRFHFHHVLPPSVCIRDDEVGQPRGPHECGPFVPAASIGKVLGATIKSDLLERASEPSGAGRADSLFEDLPVLERAVPRWERCVPRRRCSAQVRWSSDSCCSPCPCSADSCVLDTISGVPFGQHSRTCVHVQVSGYVVEVTS